MDLRVARIVTSTEAEGPHLRFALWTAGCSLRCPGCCNPELFAPESGEVHPVAQLVARIDAARRLEGIEGVTILGGEPTEQLEPLISLCRAVQRSGLGVIVFTGMTLEQLRPRAGFQRLWQGLDTLVDGPFRGDLREPSTGRRFIGSTNQRLHHRSERYADSALWRGPNRAELRIDVGGDLSIHGHPDEVRRLRRLVLRDAAGQADVDAGRLAGGGARDPRP